MISELDRASVTQLTPKRLARPALPQCGEARGVQRDESTCDPRDGRPCCGRRAAAAQATHSHFVRRARSRVPRPVLSWNMCGGPTLAKLTRMGRDDSLHEGLARRSAGAALGVFGPVLEDLWKGAAEERRRRSSVALKAAEDTYGASREEIAEHIKLNAAAVPLLVRFLSAAGENGFDDVLEMIGRTLGEALRALDDGDQDRFSEMELLLRSLEDLTPDHVHVLRVYLAMKDADDQYVIDNSGVSRRVFPLILADLIGSGLVRQKSGFGGGSYSVTEAAELVVAAAETIIPARIAGLSVVRQQD